MQLNITKEQLYSVGENVALQNGSCVLWSKSIVDSGVNSRQTVQGPIANVSSRVAL